MELSFIQIGLILIVTMIAAVDQFNFLESLYRPIVIGPIVGAIMGDLQTGLIVGGSYELMMIGAMPVGGAHKDCLHAACFGYFIFKRLVDKITKILD